MVRFNKNEVLEDLYRAVGIKTICIDPGGKASSGVDRIEVLSQFMMDLSVKVSPNGVMPDSSAPMFMSRGIIKRLLDGMETRRSKRGSIRRASFIQLSSIEHIVNRKTLPPMYGEVDACIGKIARLDFSSRVTAWAISFMSEVSEIGPGTAYALIRSLTREGSRNIVLAERARIDWPKVWSMPISLRDAEEFVAFLDNELDHHQFYQFDQDLAYTFEIVSRIACGQIIVDIGKSSSSGGRENLEKVVQLAKETAERVSAEYPSASKVLINQSGLSDLSELLTDIENKAQTSNEEDEGPPDDGLIYDDI